MSDELTFMMGEFAAQFPIDRHYCKNHMWARHVDGSRYRFGFAAYAVRLLQDVYFLDWHVEEGTTLSQGQEIGEIESSKAESSLYAPVAGRLVTINQTLLKDPSAINVDKYGGGWIFEIEVEGKDPTSPKREREQLSTLAPEASERKAVEDPPRQQDSSPPALAEPVAHGDDTTKKHAHTSVGMAPEGLLTPEQYLEHLDSVWAITQRTIKGQLNE